MCAHSVPVMIYVLVGIIHTEGLINGGALCHELDGAARVSRNVTDRHEPERQQTQGWVEIALHCITE